MTVNNKQRENCKISLPNKSHEKKHQLNVSGSSLKGKDILLLGDGAIGQINIRRVITCSFPSATVTDVIDILPSVISKHQGVKQLILHVGAVDIRKGETEVLKKDFNELFERLDKVKLQSFISGPLPNIDRRMNKFSRLLQLNTWLSKVCESRGLHFIDNFNLFWQRDDLFKGKGPHLSRGGVRRLMDNLLYALRNQNGPGQGHKSPKEKKPSRHEQPPREEWTTPAAPTTKPAMNTTSSESSTSSYGAPLASSTPSADSSLLCYHHLHQWAFLIILKVW